MLTPIKTIKDFFRLMLEDVLDYRRNIKILFMILALALMSYPATAVWDMFWRVKTHLYMESLKELEKEKAELKAIREQQADDIAKALMREHHRRLLYQR